MPAHAYDECGTYRIVALDPGTAALGVAVIDVDPETGHLYVNHATTLDVLKEAQRYPQIAALHGDRVSKLHALERALVRIFLAWKPDQIVSEAPYMGRFPQAYAALVECVTSIRRAVMSYDRTLPLPTIDPATVKKSVGVSGKSGDKSAMLSAIQSRDDLTLCVNLSDLDEHAIDAIAVGYAHYKLRTV